ncbi:MFS transporter, partial [Streptomyces sp. SID12501]|uniref:MFS transporter n=1 Tax=Streptomyces sp. SID12501 TaxID=2706042 RepID=UPI001EF38137
MTAVDRSVGVPVAGEQLAALRRRVSGVLVASQILGGLGVATGVALASVLAQRISGTESLSGLAPTAMVTGTAVASLPMAALMTARGRRPGLILGYLVGALGAGVVVFAAVIDSFPLLLCGMAGFGAASSANLGARFAAADLAEADRRARAISNVVWATTIGAVLGPVWSRDLVSPRCGKAGGPGVKRWGVSTSTFGCRVGVHLPV